MTVQASGATPNTDPDDVPRGSGARAVIEWVVVLAGAILIALVIRAFLVQLFYIPSASMSPTLLENDRVVVNKLSYRLHDVNRGDVVVFELGANTLAPDATKDLIKRVIGLPGESIAFNDNKVFINGQPLNEPYLLPNTMTVQGKIPCTLEKPCKVPADQIYVMGDNRTNSSDSRYIGTVPENQIVGRAFTRVWPFNRLGGL
ncbi:MAG: signal peptidase I [Actinobacteria bacterium]|nr:signal peptidase I [Actinomycetota bacterium]